MSSGIPGFSLFEFDLPDALLRNLVAVLDRMGRVPLTPQSVESIPDEQGVYQLFLDDEPVYVGKTDADAGLRKRLARHSRKIQHRQELDPSRVTFKAVRIFVFTAVDLETDLIKHYGGTKGLAWNGSGFGSNDPGRERDTTKNKPENYDYKYPIDIDVCLELDFSKAKRASEALDILRNSLPYTFRVQRGVGRRNHPDIESVQISMPDVQTTARKAIQCIVGALPSGWQATKLLGYVILYKERKDYPQSEVIMES